MNLHTLHVEHAVLLAVYTLLTLVNTRIHKGIRGIYWFSVYNGLLFVGAVLVAMRGHLPDALSIVGGTMFVICGYVALFISLARFFGKRLSQLWVQLILAVAGLASMVQYGWVHPETGKRLLAYSILLCAQQAHVAWFTARKERRRTHAAASMAVIFAALALMNLTRIVTVLTNVIPQDYLSAQGILVLLVLVNTALQCGAIVAYVWMTAGLVRGDLVVQASTDPLTGLLNRRGMEFAARSVLSNAGAGQLTSVIAIDLDDFKQINDSFGHGCGDATLVAVARCLQLGLRHSDFVGRMGGDEFLALLPNTPAAVAREIADKLHHAIRSLKIVAGDAVVTASASLGSAEVRGPGGEWGHLLIECDRQLYQEKNKRYRDGGRRSGERLAIAAKPEYEDAAQKT